ncbi:MAG: helix-turn-helix domain-containing protein [Rhodospirillales bacterium]|nr:helix-turn-helix domain-containing protein [Rhodospirillales bacterium]
MSESKKVHLSDDETALLTEKQLAKKWNVSIKTIQAWRFKGIGIRYVKIGRSVRFRLRDVLEYEEAHLVDSTSCDVD